MKFIVILVIVLGMLLMGVLFFLKIIRNTLASIFNPTINNKKRKDDEILYKDEEIVVLKGEAKQKRNNWKDNLSK
jgi:hypothetical protein